MLLSGPAPGGGGITPAKWRGGARPDQGVSGRRERETVLVNVMVEHLDCNIKPECCVPGPDFYLAREHSLIMKSSKLISASSANFSYDNRDYSSLINLNMWRLPTKEKHHK